MMKKYIYTGRVFKYTDFKFIDMSIPLKIPFRGVLDNTDVWILLALHPRNKKLLAEVREDTP